MNTNATLMNTYLAYCKSQKCLDSKTMKAYQIDLKQFCDYFAKYHITEITTDLLEEYIALLHQTFRPKTVRRKIASIKVFFRYLEYKDLLEKNPFNKLQIRFREPIILPKVIPLTTIETLLRAIYTQQHAGHTPHQKKTALRDAAIIEVLFATGIRISELCSLKKNNVDLHDGTVLIYGKGNKERRLQICNCQVMQLLRDYSVCYKQEIALSDYFFVTSDGGPINDQIVRRMIKKYSRAAQIDLHITPHMFRHTFATSLLEQDVDIRYIQEMLGHSSITVTEIYTHVAVSKQRNILASKHPRNIFSI